jgi:hypothetical protein
MMDDQIDELKEAEKARLNAAADEAAPSSSARRRARRRSGAGGSWLPGLVLIALGLFFLLGNLLPFTFLTNWWALFILIPALANLSQAWRRYQADGRLSASARGSLIGGLMIGTVALIFLFGLDWGKVWPVFIIILGFSALLGARG